MDTIGARIRHARLSAKLQAVKLAEVVGVRPHTVWRWEAGRMSPTGQSVAEIANALRVTADWLLTGKGPGPSEPDVVAAESTT